MIFQESLSALFLKKTHKVKHTSKNVPIHQSENCHNSRNLSTNFAIPWPLDGAIFTLQTHLALLYAKNFDVLSCLSPSQNDPVAYMKPIPKRMIKLKKKEHSFKLMTLDVHFKHSDIKSKEINYVR